MNGIADGVQGTNLSGMTKRPTEEPELKILKWI